MSNDVSQINFSVEERLRIYLDKASNTDGPVRGDETLTDIPDYHALAEEKDTVDVSVGQSAKTSEDIASEDKSDDSAS